MATGMHSPGNVSHSMNHAPLARAVADSFAGYSGPGVENGGKRVARAHRDLVHTSAQGGRCGVVWSSDGAHFAHPVS